MKRLNKTESPILVLCAFLFPNLPFRIHIIVCRRKSMGNVDSNKDNHLPNEP